VWLVEDMARVKRQTVESDRVRRADDLISHDLKNAAVGAAPPDFGVAKTVPNAERSDLLSTVIDGVGGLNRFTLNRLEMTT